MFRNIVYSTCCAVSLLVGVVMIDDVNGMEIREYPMQLDNGIEILYQHLPSSFEGDFLQEYNDGYTGFSTCETDGCRFLEEDFITEYQKNRFARIDDGRPELALWFHYLLEFSVFENWSVDDRYLLDSFIKSMLDVFSNESFRERDISTKLNHVSSLIADYEHFDSV